MPCTCSLLLIKGLKFDRKLQYFLLTIHFLWSFRRKDAKKKLSIFCDLLDFMFRVHSELYRYLYFWYCFLSWIVYYFIKTIVAYLNRYSNILIYKYVHNSNTHIRDNVPLHNMSERTYLLIYTCNLRSDLFLLPFEQHLILILFQNFKKVF